MQSVVKIMIIHIQNPTTNKPPPPALCPNPSFKTQRSPLPFEEKKKRRNTPTLKLYQILEGRAWIGGDEPLVVLFKGATDPTSQFQHLLVFNGELRRVLEDQADVVREGLDICAVIACPNSLAHGAKVHRVPYQLTRDSRRPE